MFSKITNQMFINVLSKHVFAALCLAVFVTLVMCYVYYDYEVENDPVSFRANDLVDNESDRITKDNESEKITKEDESRSGESTTVESNHTSTMFNILMWTFYTSEPFSFLQLGRDGFFDMGCEYNNCYLTDNKSYLPDIKLFDAVMFHAPETTAKRLTFRHEMPKERDFRQIYIYVCVESAPNYPICVDTWNEYFNWTMTYKLDSDLRWPYVIVRDKNSGAIIGPDRNIKWVEKMDAVDEDFINNNLANKTKAAAWFVSNCGAKSRRMDYGNKLKEELVSHGLDLDMYGDCGNLKCPRDSDICWKYLRDDYFFYLSFENSFSDDYVTEKLLTGLSNNAVPIVLGAGNYSWFAPPNSYIDATHMNPKDLANLMKHLMDNVKEYSDYFRWKKYYTFDNVYTSYDSHPLCSLCKKLNEPEDKRNKIARGLRSWWNGEEGEKICS